MTALRETIPLETRKIVKKSLPGALFFGVLAVGSWWVFRLEPVDVQPAWLRPYLPMGAPLLCVLLAIGQFVYQYVYFVRYFYDMDGNNIIIRKGALAQKEITLPFSRITDVYIDQDVLDVMFRIYDFHISTPTEQSGEFAHIDGVNYEGAQRLREMTLNQLNQ